MKKLILAIALFSSISTISPISKTTAVVVSAIPGLLFFEYGSQSLWGVFGSFGISYLTYECIFKPLTPEARCKQAKALFEVLKSETDKERAKLLIKRIKNLIELGMSDSYCEDKCYTEFKALSADFDAFRERLKLS